MRYRTKAEWAAARASELEALALQPRTEMVSARSYARDARGIELLLVEAARFRAMALRFAEHDRARYRQGNSRNGD